MCRRWPSAQDIQTCSLVLDTWPVAWTLNSIIGGSFPCRHMGSVLASDTVRPNAVHIFTIASIIFSILPGDYDRMPASSEHSLSQGAHNIPYVSRTSVHSLAAAPVLRLFIFITICPRRCQGLSANPPGPHSAPPCRYYGIAAAQGRTLDGDPVRRYTPLHTL